jgi:hypothetical protein
MVARYPVPNRLPSLGTTAIETKRPRSPLFGFNYRVFVVPVVLMLVGGLIWILTFSFWSDNYGLILLGEVIFAIGLFAAIMLGFWLMTLVRMPRR